MYFEKAIQINEWVKPLGNIGEDWHVFDGCLCINDNVILKENTFTLNANPVDRVNILSIGY